MKHCIPLQRFETVTIEMVNCNIETDWFDFKIKFEGVCSTEVRLTGHTIELINQEAQKMIKKIKKGNK